MESIVSNPLFGFIALVGMIIWAVYSYFDKKKRERHQEFDKENEWFVQRYKELRKDFDILKERFDLLFKEHESLKDIIKERDPDSIRFRQEGFEAFEDIKKVNDLIVKNNEISGVILRKLTS